METAFGGRIRPLNGWDFEGGFLRICNKNRILKWIKSDENGILSTFFYIISYHQKFAKPYRK
jgi:hypothetical protein